MWLALLIRSPRGLALTVEGTQFLDHARAILAHVEASVREVGALQGLETGQVTIGAPPMVAGHLLPRTLDTFLERHPGVRVSVVQAGAEEIAVRVSRGVIDVGLVADWKRSPGLVSRVLQRHPIVACAGRGSALDGRDSLTWAELLDQPIIAFPPGYHQRALLDQAARRFKRVPRIVAEAESVPLILELVRRGKGVATLLAAAGIGLPGIRVLAMPRDAVVPVAVCYRDGNTLSLPARAFHDLVVKTRLA